MEKKIQAFNIFTETNDIQIFNDPMTSTFIFSVSVLKYKNRIIRFGGWDETKDKIRQFLVQFGN